MLTPMLTPEQQMVQDAILLHDQVLGPGDARWAKASNLIRAKLLRQDVISKAEVRLRYVKPGPPAGERH